MKSQEQAAPLTIHVKEDCPKKRTGFIPANDFLAPLHRRLRNPEVATSKEYNDVLSNMYQKLESTALRGGLTQLRKALSEVKKDTLTATDQFLLQKITDKVNNQSSSYNPSFLSSIGGSRNTEESKPSNSTVCNQR